MDTAQASRSMRRLADNGFAHAPRLALIGAIALLLAIPVGLPTLAFVPKSAIGAIAKIEAGSPLRLVLPEPSSPIVDTRSVQTESQSQRLADDALETQREGTGFDNAFGSIDLAATSGSAKPANPVDLKPGRFLDLKYDLARLEPAAEKIDRSDGSLTVEKPLIVDGVAAGSATIRIEEGAKILISASSIAKALGPKAGTLPKRVSGAIATGKGFIPFYELRGAGIAVEYDAVRDRVAMSLPS